MSAAPFPDGYHRWDAMWTNTSCSEYNMGHMNKAKYKPDIIRIYGIVTTTKYNTGA